MWSDQDWSQHPSSGALKTVTATSGIGHNTGTAASFQRGLIRIHDARNHEFKTYQTCSVRQALKTNGNTIAPYLCFQVFIDDGNTLLNSERVCSDL